jgi:hypothetical protein
MIAACGGGGGGPDNVQPEPETLRTDLLYGYYLSFDNQTAETRDHVNLVHEGNWFGSAPTIASMAAHGKATMLDLNQTVYQGNDVRADAEQRLVALFDALRASGVLAQVVALYPIDEPQASAGTVEAANALIRRAASGYPELSGVKLAVIYDLRGTPGIATYDWIGLDHYPSGADILTSSHWKSIVASLRPGQRTLLVPGGGDPFQQDPEPFRRYAHNNAHVVGILPFMWARQHPSEVAGIGTNGMAPQYRALGLQLTGGAP